MIALRENKRLFQSIGFSFLLCFCLLLFSAAMPKEIIGMFELGETTALSFFFGVTN